MMFISATGTPCGQTRLHTPQPEHQAVEGSTAWAAGVQKRPI
jgi:hypothetical protein